MFSSIKDIKENDNPEDEADIADVLFSQRSKLFRWDSITKLWKEHGVVDIIIRKHRETSKVRVIMQGDQILKFFCNHEDMKLMPGSTENSWLLHTQCDELPEIMAVRFKNVNVANNFKEIFDKCVAI